MKKNKKDGIWDDASTLRPDDLSETEVHVTLRVEPRLYRKVLEEQKRSKDRTVTATIERILRSSFEELAPSGRRNQIRGSERVC